MTNVETVGNYARTIANARKEFDGDMEVWQKWVVASRDFAKEVGVLASGRDVAIEPLYTVAFDYEVAADIVLRMYSPSYGELSGPELLMIDDIQQSGRIFEYCDSIGGNK